MNTDLRDKLYDEYSKKINLDDYHIKHGLPTNNNGKVCRPMLRAISEAVTPIIEKETHIYRHGGTSCRLLAIRDPWAIVIMWHGGLGQADLQVVNAEDVLLKTAN